jgi:nicotinamide-nucleotide amidase
MGHRLQTAEILSIGSELAMGQTRDTNAGELARSLTDAGVRVGRLCTLPDDLGAVTDAFRDALGRADLVVSTGGLGPTPDDLTREGLAAACDEHAQVDQALEAWLRGLWKRRRLPFPEVNVKQAWLIPSATAIPNPNGTAPGWWVERPDGRLAVALPGPPREMRVMWRDWALPRLRERGFGGDHASRTYRTAGIGESQIASLLGDDLLRSRNPLVATYARADAVDIRISAVPEEPSDGRTGRSAEALVADAEAAVLAHLGRFVWGRGEDTWPAAIGDRLAEIGWTLATVEIGTGGALVALLSEVDRLRFAEVLAPDAPLPGSADLLDLAATVRSAGRADVGLALRAEPRGDDTDVSVAIVTPAGSHRERRLAFLRGPMGRSRAGLAAAAVLLERLNLERLKGDDARAPEREDAPDQPVMEADR